MFDTSKKALAFALNHSRDSTGQPLMLKYANSLSEKSAGVTTKNFDAERLNREDSIILSGMILGHLATLPPYQQAALVATAARRTYPCACRQPCCSGFKPNKDWVDAVKQLCEHIRHTTDAMHHNSGKKRIHTNPQLRRMLVEKHFGQHYVLADLAEQFQITEATVINHRKPITLMLTNAQKDGQSALDEALTRAGIVG